MLYRYKSIDILIFDILRYIKTQYITDISGKLRYILIYREIFMIYLDILAEIYRFFSIIFDIFFEIYLDIYRYIAIYRDIPRYLARYIDISRYIDQKRHFCHDQLGKCPQNFRRNSSDI